MGGSPQFARAVSMALAPPSVRPHAAQLDQWRLRKPPIQVERHPDDGTEQCHSGVYGRIALGCGACMHLHGLRVGMAVAQT